MTDPVLQPYWCNWAELADLAGHLAARTAAKAAPDALAWAEISALVGAVAKGADLPARTLHRRDLAAAIDDRLGKARIGSDAYAALAELARQFAPWNEGGPLARLSNTARIERNHQLNRAARAGITPDRKAA